METELLNTVVKQNKTVANATDPYNIFSVLSIETKEVLICRVIGDFLNPRGKHGENSKFLSLFLKEIPELQHIACEQLDQAIVTTEYVIDEKHSAWIIISLQGSAIRQQKWCTSPDSERCQGHIATNQEKSVFRKKISSAFPFRTLFCNGLSHAVR